MKKFFIILLAGLIGTFAFAETFELTVGKKDFAPLEVTKYNDIVCEPIVTEISKSKIDSIAKVTYAVINQPAGAKSAVGMFSYTCTYYFKEGDIVELGKENQAVVTKGKFKVLKIADNVITFEVLEPYKPTVKPLKF